MSYQIRHKEWGVFQGEFLGLSFWHPMSNEPEQGFYEFQSLEDAERFADIISKGSLERKSEFSLEPFNAELSRLMQEGKVKE